MHRIRSFKVRLVLSFVALSLLPLAAAFYSFSSVVGRSEDRRLDARIQAGLRAALTAYGDELQSAQHAATQLARDPRVQTAMRDGDTATLRRIARTVSAHARFGRSATPRVAPMTAARTVSVYAGRRLLGSVTVDVRLNGELVGRLRAHTGLDRVDRLVAVRGGRVVLGPLHGRVLQPSAERVAVVDVAGVEYRALAAAPLSEPAGVSFAVLSPQSLAASAAAATERRLLVTLLSSLALIALAAYVLSRSVVGRLRDLALAATAIAGGRLSRRVPVQGRDEFAALARSFNDMAAQLEARVGELETARERLREATARFGEALEATHDPAHLRQVIVESVVEATGASGGALEQAGERVVAGDPEAGPERLELPLASGTLSFGLLVLAGAGFGDDARETAASLAGQAVIALENARLHAIVERQALVDGLTGLANRRRSDEMLRLELSRAARLAAPLALVLVDVDRFKSVNDRYGHPVGDAVLRDVAALLADTVREIDVAGRWGGEEFALVLPGTDLTGAARLAERIRASLARRPIVADDGTELFVTASLGVAAFPDQATEGELISAADGALYEAKRSGRNRVVAAGAVQPTASRQSEIGHISS